jgi:ABC-type multidrug transport system ATPase subunit
VDTTLDGKAISALDKLRGKPSKKRYLLRKFRSAGGCSVPSAHRQLFLSFVRWWAGGIAGDVTSGSVLAIMGLSGAGKTTLLYMLTLEKKGGVPHGKIELNGQAFTLSLYVQHCAYVQQDDSLWASLSSRDHLHCVFDLCQPHLSPSEKEVAIVKLIEAVGLVQAQYTKAGNAFVRGLSSGLKRRLSIAIALAKNPLVIFLDEPSSGIDSARHQ